MSFCNSCGGYGEICGVDFMDNPYLKTCPSCFGRGLQSASAPLVNNKERFEKALLAAINAIEAMAEKQKGKK
jgi:hypothetical protein